MSMPDTSRYICPKCNRDDMRFDKAGAADQWCVFCDNCGYEGPWGDTPDEATSVFESYIRQIRRNAMSDQTIKEDAGKLRLSLVPSQVIRDIAEVREYGNRKYGDSESWRRVDRKRYVDALYRHMLAFVDDPASKDEESGIEHYKHLACNIAFLCEMMKDGAGYLACAGEIAGKGQHE